jgi:para-nitrobenzyl esterase
MHILRYICILMAAGFMAESCAAPAAAQNPVAQTTAGALMGDREGDLAVFRGIPYAAAPVGALRWRPPAPAQRWEGVREAREYGPVCPQSQGDSEYALRDRPMSEDCLSLNVWSPDMGTNARLPVMVWIHGGGFRLGAGGVPLYDGSALARRGVVVVTINYRLGLMGVFAHPALAEEQPNAPRANYAIMDQIAALEWVRDNIDQFGGDPQRVTIFGESAGGVSVLLHMISPRSRGLFSKAIVQSGGGWTPSPSLQQGEMLAERAAQALGAHDLAQLRAVPPERLVEVLSEVASPLGYTPVVDGEIVPASIPDAFLAGQEATAPLLIGSNTYEQSLLGASGAPLRSVLATLPFDLIARARQVYGPEIGDDDALGGALYRDGGFTGAARWLARTNTAPAYLYRYAHVRVARRGETPGPGHGAEVPFVFDSLRAISPAALLLFRAEDRAMARVVGDCWVSFARTGTPACDGATWPSARQSADGVMVFDLGRATFAPDPWRAQLDFHEQAFLARMDGATD